MGGEIKNGIVSKVERKGEGGGKQAIEVLFSLRFENFVGDNVLSVDRITTVPCSYVLVNVVRLFAAINAIGTLKSWCLAAFEFNVSVHVVGTSVRIRTLCTRILRLLNVYE